MFSFKTGGKKSEGGRESIVQGSTKLSPVDDAHGILILVQKKAVMPKKKVIAARNLKDWTTLNNVKKNTSFFPDRHFKTTQEARMKKEIYYSHKKLLLELQYMSRSRWSSPSCTSPALPPVYLPLSKVFLNTTFLCSLNCR